MLLYCQIVDLSILSYLGSYEVYKTENRNVPWIHFLVWKGTLWYFLGFKVTALSEQCLWATILLTEQHGGHTVLLNC